MVTRVMILGAVDSDAGGGCRGDDGNGGYYRANHIPLSSPGLTSRALITTSRRW